VFEQRVVQGVEVGGAHAMQRDVPEQRVDVGEDLALVPAERARTQARPTRRQPRLGEERRERHPSRKDWASPVSGLNQLGEQPLGLPAARTPRRPGATLLPSERIRALVDDRVVAVTLLHQVAPHVVLLVVGEEPDGAYR